MNKANVFSKRSMVAGLAVAWKKIMNRKTAIRTGLLASVIFIFAFGMFPGPAKAAPFSIPLENLTGLDPTQYTIYVLGYSTTSGMMLNPDGTFQQIPPGNGIIPSYAVGSGPGMLSKITVDGSVSLPGARIYFFVATAKTPAPSLPYSNGGINVTQPANPPNSNYPPFGFIELTMNPSYSTTPVIDVQTVDAFIFPITITLNDNLGQVGQPRPAGVVTRESIFQSYTKFMESLGTLGQPYVGLRFTEAGGGLLNPYDYLIETNAANEYVHLSSTLNTVFDPVLNTLFSNKDLSLQGVAYGSIPADVYTVVSTTPQNYPGSTFSVPALQFKGQQYNNVFNIFNPVGLTVYLNPKTHAPIKGTIVNTSLTFSESLPAKTLVENMYVGGAGTNPANTIASLVLNKQGEITGATLNQNLGSPAPNSTYIFSKVPALFVSSGAMVFGNVGVFADSTVQYPTNGDSKAVLANLENQIVSALNRGVANPMIMRANPAPSGYTSAFWNTETYWYPHHEPQNLFSLYMHTGRVESNGISTPIFVQPNSPAQNAPPVKNAQGQYMGMAYGFAYDETPGGPGPAGQPQVPSKFDPTPAGTTTMTVTLGPWK